MMDGETKSRAGMPPRLSDALLEILVKESDREKKSGLFLVDMPTGYGKSYAAANLLGRFVANDSNEKRRIFFITPQKKNLPKDGDIARAFELAGLGEPAPGQVMRVQPISAMMAETARWDVLGDIPDRFRGMKELGDLVREADHYRSAVGLRSSYGDDYAGIEEAAKAKLGEAERAFRRVASKALADVRDGEREGKPLTPRQRIGLLRDNSEWQWLGRLYPTAFTREATILLMSFDKFLCNHVTLVEPVYRFIDSDLVKDAVVIIDEFDSSKPSHLEKIIGDSLGARADLPELVRTAHAALSSKERPAELTRPSKQWEQSGRMESPAKALDSAERVVASAFKDANLRYELKAADGETRGEFLFHDYRYEAVMNGDYEVVRDEGARVNAISRVREAPGREESLKWQLGRMRGAVSYVQRVAGSVALNYQQRLSSPGNPFSIENAQRSVVDWLGFHDGAQRDFMLEGVRSGFRNARAAGSRDASAGDLSVYARGLHLVTLEDGDDHGMSTHIRVSAMQETPESVMLQLMRRARVIGMSATATLDSPLCNYDIEYLDAQSGGLVERVSGDDLEEMRRAYAEQNAGYEKVDINVEVVKAAGDSVDAWAEVLGSREAALEAFAIVDGLTGYAQHRYARVVSAYRYFIGHDDIRSMLVLAAPAPKRPDYDFGVIESLCGIAFACSAPLQATRGRIRRIAGSTGFDEEYKQVKDELAQGGKVFLVASYGTMGAGVNIQYPVPAGVETVEVHPLERSDDKDFDAIYLDQPTHLAPYAHAGVDDAKLMEYLYELSELRERGEISADEFRQSCRAIAKKRIDPNSGLKAPPLKGRRSAKGRGTRLVNQALGRICRTNRKNPTIHILADAEIAQRIDPFALDGRMVNEEYKALLGKLVEAGAGPDAADAEAERRVMLEQRGSLVSSRLNSHIQGLIKQSAWRRGDMEHWEALRAFALAHPTIADAPDAANRGFVDGAYVRLPESACSYSYKQTGDFSEVEVSFASGDKFPLVVSAEAARLSSLASVPLVANHFRSMGWPLTWESGRWLMSPTLFHNVYLGALGEQVGKLLLERFGGGLVLKVIDDPEMFEVFDFRVAGTGYFVDFKYWAGPRAIDEQAGEDEFLRKLERVGGEKAIVCNVLGDGSAGLRCRMLGGGKILTVPLIIDESSGVVDIDGIGRIADFLRGGETA